MADDKPQLITPPNPLKNKVGTGGPGAVDLSTLERAEKVIADLAETYLEWVEQDLVKLHKALQALSSATGDRKAELEAIYQISHDMKGQGGSFGYQLITVVGNQLCRLDAGASSCCRIAVGNRLKGHIVRLDDHEVGATPKPRINLVIQCRPF